MQYVYWYKAVNGFHMPNFHEGPNAPVFTAESQTPIVRVVALSSPEVRRAVTECLEAQRSVTPKAETGLRWNLDKTIEKLKS